jgi:HAD superfamily hydrolase (TIGR01662 family)
MGRYLDYFQEIWKLQANRKVIGLALFNVLVDNTKTFTPGDQVKPLEGIDKAIQLLSSKGYDFVIITGQPVNRSKLLDINDFENIIGGAREFITQLGGRVRNVYFAPSIDKNDPYVKPNPGMFEKAQSENNFKWADTIFVGSEPNDVKAVTKVKGIPVLIKSSNTESKMKSFELSNNIKIQEYSSLLEFATSLD